MFGATGIILFWRGVWEGAAEIPIVENIWVSLFLGLVMLTFSGIIFHEFDPMGGLEKSALKIMHSVHHHPRKKEFTITYHDKLTGKDVKMRGEHIHNIEKNVISFHTKRKEVFVPIHRIMIVHQKGKVIWRL